MASGRPTAEEAAARRRRVASLALTRAARDAELVGEIARAVGTAKTVVARDLGAMAEAVGRAPEPVAERKGGAAALEDLVAKAGAAETLEQLDEIARELSGLLAGGDVEPNTARALVDVIRERRRTRAQIVEESERMKAGAPVVVEVRWLSDWRDKLKANEAAAR